MNTINFRQLISSTLTGPDTVLFLQHHGLLAPSNICHCGKAMSLGNRLGGDGKVWNCTSKSCRSKMSVRNNTIFQKSKLKLNIILSIIYCFVVGLRAIDCQNLILGDASYRTILVWYGLCRDVMSQALNDEEAQFMFKLSDISLGAVEIDESLFGKKKKNDKGTSRQKHLVFGIVDRCGTRCIFRIVNTNSREQLFPIIKRYVNTDCVIYHDGLATYDTLSAEGYRDCKVCHNLEFVTSDGVHTNTIEGLWGLLKQRIAYMHGLPSLNALAAHLDEYSYRSIFGKSKDKAMATFMSRLAKYGKTVLEVSTIEAPESADCNTPSTSTDI